MKSTATIDTSPTANPPETVKEKRARLRAERNLAADRASTRRDALFIRYAEIVLQRILLEPQLHPLEFACDKQAGSIFMRQRAVSAVMQMADDLTTAHIQRNP